MKKRNPRRKVGYNIHHRKPRFKGGSNKPSNLSLVKIPEHRAWHLLFGTSNPAEIARHINETWLDPDWELVARRKK